MVLIEISMMEKTNYKEQAIDMCVGKTSDEIMSIICEAKENGAPFGLIQQLQQIWDLSTEESHALEFKETVLSAWTNYCRGSWAYRLLERFGFR